MRFRLGDRAGIVLPGRFRKRTAHSIVWYANRKSSFHEPRADDIGWKFFVSRGKKRFCEANSCRAVAPFKPA